MKKYALIALIAVCGCNNEEAKTYLTELQKAVEGGKEITFRSHNGVMQGSDNDIDITMKKAGHCDLTFYMDRIDKYEGEYTVKNNIIEIVYGEYNVAFNVEIDNKAIVLKYKSGTIKINDIGDFRTPKE